MKTLFLGPSPNTLSTPVTSIPQPVAEALGLPVYLHHPQPTPTAQPVQNLNPGPSNEQTNGAKTSTQDQSQNENSAKCKKLKKINGRPRKDAVTAELIRSMQVDGKKSISQIAKELGVSIRTVKYRLSATRNWWKEF